MENEPITSNNQEPIHQRFMNHKLASVGIAVVVLAVATGIAFWQKSSVEAPSQQPNEMSDWKTYSNTELGVEFNYPTNYVLSSGESRVELSSSQVCKDNLKTSSAWQLNCVVYTLLVQGNKITGPKTTATQVAGYPAERFEDQGGMWEGVEQTYIQFNKDNKWYISSISYHSTNKSVAENILNQVILSLRFDGSQSVETNTNGWETYSNAKYGFEFKYPAQKFNSQVSDTSWFELSLHDKIDRQMFSLSVSVNQPGRGAAGTATYRGKINIGGVTADKVIMELTEGHEKGWKTVYYTFTNRGNEYLIIGSGISSNDQADEIVSTFKFFEPTQSSNLKTYSNAEYGFEFKYPTAFSIRPEEALGNGTTQVNVFINTESPRAGAQDAPPLYLMIGAITAAPFVELYEKNPSYCPGGEEITEFTTKNGLRMNKCISSDGEGLFIGLLHDQYLYTFESGLYKKNTKDIDQILSTFKFTK